MGEYLSEEQRKIATDNHNLVYKFMCKYNLNNSEWYDIVVFGYLRGIATWDMSRGKLSTWLYKNMEYSMMKELNRYNKKEIDSNGDVQYKNKIEKVEYLDEVRYDEHCFDNGIALDCIELISSLEARIDRMTYNQLRILTLKARGYTFDEIGVEIGMSKQRISQINKRALSILAGEYKNSECTLAKDVSKNGENIEKCKIEYLRVLRAICVA